MDDLMERLQRLPLTGWFLLLALALLALTCWEDADGFDDAGTAQPADSFGAGTQRATATAEGRPAAIVSTP